MNVVPSHLPLIDTRSCIAQDIHRGKHSLAHAQNSSRRADQRYGAPPAGRQWGCVKAFESLGDEKYGRLDKPAMGYRLGIGEIRQECFLDKHAAEG
jgi:hypothetical protein